MPMVYERKHYRPDAESGYSTQTITMSKIVFSAVNEIVEKESDKNMSRFIEETVRKHLPYKNKKEIPKRRAYREYPVKKTFTFTHDFVSKIKEYGNTSIFIETVLKKALNINPK
jgi:metal-responsive CopG/Arc/MetJ family transcriptional regulator